MSRRPFVALLIALPVLAALPPIAQAQELGFRVLQPCRVIDTRPSSPLLPGQVRTFTLRGSCGIPYRTTDGGVEANPAVAVALNVVAVNAAGAGHITAWAANKPMPNASTVNFSAGSETGGLNIANGVIVPMCDEVTSQPCGTGDINVMAAVSAVHLVVDVVGYFAVQVVPGSVRYGMTGIDAFLCRNQTTGIRYGLSRKIGTYTDAHRLCPAGTWVCSLSDMGTSGCNTARPDGTCDSIECTGACQDLAESNHRGWVSKASTSTTSGITFSEGGTETAGGLCQYNPVWCCSRE